MKTQVQLASQALAENNLGVFNEIIMGAPELVDKAGKFWLHRAAGNGNIEAMERLHQLGVDLNSSDYTGTALSKAASNGEVGSVKWLLDHGVSLNFDDKEISNNPLFSSIQNMQVDVARLLIEKGIDTNITYPCGRDALAFAKQWGCEGVIILLGGNPKEAREPWVKTAFQDFSGQKMSNEILAAIEGELGINIPKFYREFLMRSFPEKLFFSNAEDNDNWIWLGPDYLMFHTLRSFIAYNSKDARKDKKIVRHPGFLVIGTDGGGNEWCIRTDGKDQSVYYFDHETEEFENLNCTIYNHANNILNQ